jgi:ATP-dependent DNA helicase RecG
MTIKEIKRLRETEDRVEFKEAKTQYAYNSGRKSVLGYGVVNKQIYQNILSFDKKFVHLRRLKHQYAKGRYKS